MTRARDLAAGTFELATGGVLKLETSDTTVTDGSVLGKIEFKAPDEASGTDAILVGAAIEAVAEGTFAADNNATELVFKTGASAAADAKMTLTSGGNLGIGTSSPSTTLDLVGSWVSNTGVLSIDTPSGETYSGLAILNNGAVKGFLYHDNSAGALDLQTYTTDALRFKTNNTERMRIDATGAVTMPAQPAFQAHKNGSDQSNLAVGNDVSITWTHEAFDQNSDFDLSNNRFVAPVTGKYQLNLMIRLENLKSSSAYYVIRITTSNQSYSHIVDPDYGQDNVYYPVQISILADMDANDTAFAVFRQQSGAAETDIDGDREYTNFSGYLVA